MKRRFDLQLFADEKPANAEQANAQTETMTETVKTEAAPASILKDQGEPKYTDSDVDKILDKKFAEWQKKQQKAVDEAQKLATMNATQKAEYERDQLQKELAELKRVSALSEMSKAARKMLSDKGITISDELLTVMVAEEAETTKAAVDSFAQMFTEAVEAAVKERLKGESPKKGSGGLPNMTKEQIRAIKDPELRQQKIAEHKELFNF